MTQLPKRKFAPDRYFKRADLFLDHDGSKYANTYRIFDGDKDTGISITERGDSNEPNSNVRSIYFNGQKYPLLRDAVIAYEDAVA
jgi:hypothetical protein